MFRKIATVLLYCLDLSAILYFTLFVYWMAILPNDTNSVVNSIFGIINPFTVGVYCLGGISILNVYCGLNKIVSTLFIMAYLFNAITSLILIMGMTNYTDMIVFLPHLIIVLAMVYVCYKRYENKSIKEND